MLWHNGALANENVAGRPGLFRRHGEHVGAGLHGNTEGLGRSHVVVKGIEDIDARQFVAVTLDDSLDGELAYLQTELGVLL